MKSVILALLLLGSLTACNTVRGVGKDVKSGGEAIQEGADAVEDSISN